MIGREELLALAERVARIEHHCPNTDLVVADALGWFERRVTRLSLNGRTPGSYLWFPPDGSGKGARRPPRFTGPRKRKAAVMALRALAEQQP